MTDTSSDLITPPALEDVLITDALGQRQSRVPDHEAQARAMARLAAELATNPRGALRTVVEATMALCHGDSAGVSILDSVDQRDVVRWHATAGALAGNTGTTAPRAALPSGTAAARNELMLLHRPERAFPSLLDVEPSIHEALLVPWDIDGAPAGTLWVTAHAADRRFDLEDARVLQSLAPFAAAAWRSTLDLDAAEVGRAELARRVEEHTRLASAANHALQASESRLAAELADAKRLQTASAQLIRDERVEDLYQTLLDAAIGIMRSDCASMQLLVKEQGARADSFRLLASRGFTAEAEAFWAWVDLESPTSCGRAGRARERSILPDVESIEELAGTADLEMFRQTGICAVQSTPLVSRGGEMLGMISTHWREPHTPSERDLRLLDVLVRQAADLLERRLAAERERAVHEEAKSARSLAEAANRSKSDFLKAMSHELRTPLNAIAGHAQLLMMEVHGPVTETQRQAISRIQRNEEHLLFLINQVLNFAKIEAGQVTYLIEDVPLHDVISDVLSIIDPLLVRGELTASVDVSAAVVARADREKVGQILLNLVANAIKFTPPGGQIAIDAPRRDGMPDGRVLVRVLDTGIGIARDRQESIFEPFVQVQRSLRQPTEGTGLGLAISRDLARGMGGDLRVRSSAGTGSTFTLSLPQAPGGSA